MNGWPPLLLSLSLDFSSDLGISLWKLGQTLSQRLKVENGTAYKNG